MQPKNSDVGGYHIAIYVDDVKAADTYLKSKGVKAVRIGGKTGSRLVLSFKLVQRFDPALRVDHVRRREDHDLERAVARLASARHESRRR